MKINYSAGFLFDTKGTSVALIHKLKGPKELLNHWNAIGGRLELGETSLEAMRREFHEEAGVLINSWEPFLRLKQPTWTVDFFKAFSSKSLKEVKTCEEEQVMIFNIKGFPPNVVRSVPWMVQMALEKNKYYEVTEVSE